MSKALDHEAVKRCTACINLSQDHVPAEGNAHADIMIIGGSPSPRDVEEGRPFSGPSGELLDMMLDQAGLSREQVYLTNALKCATPGRRLGNTEEFEMCFGTWLRKELKFVNPAVVVLVGVDACNAVTNGRIEFKHGKSVKGKNRTFLTVYSPGYFLVRGNIDDFINVGDVLKKLYATSE